MFEEGLKNNSKVVSEEPVSVQQLLQSLLGRNRNRGFKVLPHTTLSETRRLNGTWKSRLTWTSSCSSGDRATGSMRHEQKDLRQTQSRFQLKQP